MAGSRLPKIGDIFTRTTGLLRAGAIKAEDKPLWYDVYEAFPPLQAPTYERSKASSLNIRKIFYPEDLIRAQFYRKYGSPGAISLDESRKFKRPTICETFVAAYQEIQTQQQNFTPEQLMKETEAELERRGIYPDRTRKPRAVEAFDEPMDEDLETRSAITGAVLSDDIMKKINFKDLFDSSKTSKSSTATSSVSAASGAGSKGVAAAASSSDASVKDGSGSST